MLYEVITVFVQILDPELGALEFDFWMPVPGLKTDYMQVDADDLYENYVDLDVEGFRRWISEQPCCVTNANIYDRPIADFPVTLTSYNFV